MNPSPGSTASASPGPGEYWAYRLRENSPSERVQVESVDVTKARALVTFDDGRQENLPGVRLKVRWDEVVPYDLLMANWEKLRAEVLDEVEDSCVWLVFTELVPTDVAEPGCRPVNCTTDIHDVETFSAMLGINMSELTDTFPSFMFNDSLILSPGATLAVAERLCRLNPAAILDKVIADEAKARHKCKYGGMQTPSGKGGDSSTSPEWEYKWYIEYDKQHHELLRQWCGYRAVNSHERMTAAEAECHRLDVLLEETIATLERYSGPERVRFIRQEHERERITPYAVRPIPERPLDPSEIPVRVVYRRGGRWW